MTELEKKSTNANNPEIEYELVESESGFKTYKVWTNADPIIDRAEEQIQKESATLKMAGFREGAVPAKIARKHIGEGILSRTIDTMIAFMLQHVIKQEKLTISAPPSIDVTEFDKGKSLVCNVKFEIIESVPELDVNHPGLQNVVEILSLKVSDQDIQKAITGLKDLNKTFITAEEGYASQYGDRITIDFDGRVDSKPFENGTKTDVTMVIGDKSFIPGFEEQMIGTKSGDTKIFKTNFPNDYFVSDLADKEVVFKVLIKNVEKAQDGELDENFFSSIGITNIEELHSIISAKLKSEFSTLSRLLAKKQLFEVLDRILDMDVPVKMIEIDFKSLWAEVLPKIPKEHLSSSQDELVAKVMELAKRRVKIGLILAELAQKYDIKVTPEDLEEAKEMEKMRNPLEADTIETMYKDKKNHPKLEAAALEDKVITFILDCISLVEKEITSEEFNEIYAPDLQNIL